MDFDPTDPNAGIDFTCPVCQHTYQKKLARLVAHKTTGCPQCKTRFKVEVNRGEAAPVRPVASAAFISSRSQLLHAKIAGVSHDNADGVSRQSIIPICRPGEELILIREPDNQVSNLAVKVMRRNGQQLGYIPAYIVSDGKLGGLARRMDQGTAYRCRISDITGGPPGKYYGVNIEITDGGWPRADPAAARERLQTALSSSQTAPDPEPASMSPVVIGLLTLIGVLAVAGWIISKS